MNAKAERLSIVVIEQNEAYTSKTCSGCGFVNFNIGGRKKFICPSCQIVIDRDFNGARRIFLRALEDNSWLNDCLTCIS